MQFFDLVIIMIIAFSPSATATKPISYHKYNSTLTATPKNVSTVEPSCTPECVASSEILSTVPGKFLLRLLFPDEDGKINSQCPRPINTPDFDPFPGFYLDLNLLPVLNERYLVLENQALSIAYLEDYYAVTFGELNDITDFTFGFSSKDDRNTLLNFTATRACDDYGRSFVQLNSPDGECLTQDYIPVFFNIKLSFEPTAHLFFIRKLFFRGRCW